MGEFSKIEWTDHTFNPWIGCQEVSPACNNCYARVQNNRRKWVNGWGPHGERRRTKTWRDPIRFNREAANDGVRRKVFCASLADVFDNQVPPEWRADLWALIDATPSLDWLLLTKRPENMSQMLPLKWLNKTSFNVWLGTTAENQKDGLSLHRINAKGVPGLWACFDQVKQTDAPPIDPAVMRIERALNPRQS